LLPPEDLEERSRARELQIASLQQQISQMEQHDALSARATELTRNIEEHVGEIHRLDGLQLDLTAARLQLAGLQKERSDTAARLESKLVPLRAQLLKLRSVDRLEDVPTAYAVTEGKAQDVCIQIRGNPEQKGPVVKRGMPRFLMNSADAEIPDGQ